MQFLQYTTLESGINVGPTFINFEMFFMPFSRIKGPTLIKILKCFPWPTTILQFDFFYLS